MDHSLNLDSPPWPPGRAEMAVWSPQDGSPADALPWAPAEAGRDAGRAFEQLERLGLGLSRRIAGLAVLLVLSLTGLNWLG